MLFSRGVVLEVQRNRGKILAGIHEVRIGGDRSLKHRNGPLDVVLLEMNEAQQVENGSIIGVDAKSALTDEIAHVQLVLSVIGNCHIQIGIEIVGVSEQGNSAMLDSLVEVALL